MCGNLSRIAVIYPQMYHLSSPGLLKNEYTINTELIATSIYVELYG